MKKVISIATVILAPIALFAQDVYVLPNGSPISREFVETPLIILSFTLIGIFFLTIIRWFLDFRLKSKLINKEVPESVIKLLIDTEKKDSKKQIMKWFFILAGVGLGLAITSIMFRSVGIHSIAIMVFCIALSFLGYYLFIKRSEK